MEAEFTIDNDIDCEKHLHILKHELKLSEEEKLLLDKCLAVVTSTDGDDIEFGPFEIVELTDLAFKHTHRGAEIFACLHHLSESIEFDGDLPLDTSKIFDTMKLFADGDI